MWRLRTAAFVLAAVILFPFSARSDTASLEAGARAFEAQRYPEALERLSSAVKEEPSNAKAAELYGRALYEENELPRAVEWLERATTLDPSSSSASYWLGRAYGEQAIHGNLVARARLAGRIRRAFERALELDPDNSDARIGLLEFYLQAPSFMGGSFEKARSLTDDLRRPSVPGASGEGAPRRASEAAGPRRRGIRGGDPRLPAKAGALPLVRAQRDRPQGLALGRREHGKTPARALMTRWRSTRSAGSRRSPAGTLERGEASLRRYLEHTPKETSRHARRRTSGSAEIEERRGDRDGARREYKSALEIDPGAAGARQALAKMR